MTRHSQSWTPPRFYIGSRWDSLGVDYAQVDDIDATPHDQVSGYYVLWTESGETYLERRMSRTRPAWNARSTGIWLWMIRWVYIPGLHFAASLLLALIAAAIWARSGHAGSGADSYARDDSAWFVVASFGAAAFAITGCLCLKIRSMMHNA